MLIDTKFDSESNVPTSKFPLKIGQKTTERNIKNSNELKSIRNTGSFHVICD